MVFNFNIRQLTGNSHSSNGAATQPKKLNVDHDQLSPMSSDESAALFITSFYSAYYLIKYNDRQKVIPYIDDVDDVSDECGYENQMKTSTAPLMMNGRAVVVNGGSDNVINKRMSNGKVSESYQNGNVSNNDTRDGVGINHNNRRNISTKSNAVMSDVDYDDENAKQNLFGYYVTIWLYIWSAFSNAMET